jgi:hypothetical protein
MPVQDGLGGGTLDDHLGESHAQEPLTSGDLCATDQGRSTDAAMDAEPYAEQIVPRMGLLDRVKAAIGIGAGAIPADSLAGSKGKGSRPPLKDIAAAAPSASLDDAFEAREAGRIEEARAILIAIDRGKGLRSVEAGDEEELLQLLPGIASREAGWRLALQTACALSRARAEPEMQGRLVDFAKEHGAPQWSLAWANASQVDENVSRRGKVELLFADASLARTIAAREWKIEGAEDDREAIERYTMFAHGRDAIQRFGASLVASVVERAFGLAQ